MSTLEAFDGNVDKLACIYPAPPVKVTPGAAGTPSVFEGNAYVGDQALSVPSVYSY